MTEKEKAEELMSFYKNYRFYIAEMDCRNMAINAVKQILAVLYEYHYDSQSGAHEFYQNVLLELQKPNERSTN
jgi:hypothetical protein